MRYGSDQELLTTDGPWLLNWHKWRLIIFIKVSFSFFLMVLKSWSASMTKAFVCNTDRPKSCPLLRVANFSSKPSKSLLISAYIKKELIVPCTSPCNTPILPARKPNGKGWRLAPDLRSVNATVVPCHSVVLYFSPWTHDHENECLFWMFPSEKVLLSLNVEHGPSSWESPVKQLVGNRGSRDQLSSAGRAP